MVGQRMSRMYPYRGCLGGFLDEMLGQEVDLWARFAESMESVIVV